MGRSVNRLDNALHTLFLEYDIPDNEDHSQSGTYEWEEFENSICEIIEDKYKSFSRVENKWDNNETKIILENNHAIIGISEYGNIVSISIAVNDDHSMNENDYLAVNWIEQIWNNFDKLFRKNFPNCYLNRLGGFSNGESVYERIKEKTE